MFMDVYICHKSFEFIKQALKKPPEVCGNMDVYFKADAYHLTNFIEEYFSRSGASCIPQARFGKFGVWHTHPDNMPYASGTDIETMRRDLLSSINADTPGVPPLSLIASLVNGKPEITVYIPTFRIEMDKARMPYMLDDTPTDFWYPEIIKDKKYFYHYLFLEVEESTDAITGNVYYRIRFIQPFSSNVGDSDGIFIGSRVPAHLIPVLIVYYLKRKGSDFFILFENDGLYKVKVKSYNEDFVEVKPKVGQPDYGYEQRLKKLEESGFKLDKYKNCKIALFGAGFLGGNILSSLAKYFGEIVLVDDDIVGNENVGYQEFFSAEDVGLEKVNVLARKIEELHPQTKVYGVKARVPNFDEEDGTVIDKIVRWADIVVTAFDTIFPRLTLQMLCSKYSKPFVDAGVGTNDLTVKTWLPNSDYSCIGCYALFIGKSRRVVYASNPATSRIASSIITQICLNIVDGREVPNIIEFNLSKMSLTTNNWKRNPECPFCSDRLKLKIASDNGYTIEKEWSKETKISEFENELKSCFRIKDVRYLMKGKFVDLPKDKNLVYLKVLERNGLSIVVTFGD